MRKFAMVMLALFGLSTSGAAVAWEKFDGVCTFAGTATLDPGIGALQTRSTFTFATDGSSMNRCTGTLNGVTINNAPASAVATGSGLLSCAASTGKGTGTITINGAQFPITVKIYGTGPQVTIQAKGVRGTAVGQASFATDDTALEQCEAQNATSLNFIIAAAARKFMNW